MSRLDTLLQELCPDGVEYRPLWSVTFWDKRFQGVDKKKQPKVGNYHYLLADELFSLSVDGGNVFLLSTGEKTGWTTEELAGDNLREGEVVTIPWGKSRPVVDCIKYYNGKFVTADNRIMSSLNPEVLLNKYLYYWVCSQGKLIDSFYRGSGIKHPEMAKVLDMEIPVPPLEVQREIVRILDKFTQLRAELSAELLAELSARRIQYEHYRDEMLKFGDTVEWKELQEVFDIVDYRGKTPKKSSDGVFLVTAKNIRKGYIDYDASQEYIPCEDYEEVMHRGKPKIGDLLITTEAPCGNVALVDRDDIALAQRVIKYSAKNPDAIDMIFAKHYLLGTEFQKKLAKQATGGTVKGIKGSKLHVMKIPVPKTDVQRKIARILSDFDAYIYNLENGLPAEINYRQLQYEFYRDKLLTFKRKVTA